MHEAENRAVDAEPHVKGHPLDPRAVEFRAELEVDLHQEGWPKT